MISATFKFRVSNRDDEFEQFNEAIDAIARANPGFVRKEAWLGADSEKRAVVYYWDSLESLDRFSSDPVHLAAKRRYREWYDGFSVEVAEIVRESGDDRL